MEKLLKVGQIVNTHGIKGELRVYPLTDYKERFEELEWVYIESNNDNRFHIENIKYKNNLVILKIKGIDDLNQAEKFKTKYILIDRVNTRELPDDTYLIADLIGMEVYSEENELLGIIKDVIQSSGNDIYEISKHHDPDKRFLIPAVGEFIKEVNLERKIMVVKLVEGLME